MKNLIIMFCKAVVFIVGLYFLVGCTSGDEILPGERFPVFSYSKCSDCYVDFANKSVAIPAGEKNDFPKFNNGGYNLETAEIISLGHMKNSSTKFRSITNPVLNSGVVYTVSPSFQVKSYSSDYKENIWKVQINPISDKDSNFYPVGIAVDEDKVYLTSSLGDVFTLDKKTGKQLWVKSFDGSFNSNPTVGDDFILVVSSNNVLYALRKNSGLLVFKHKGLPSLVSYIKGSEPVFDDKKNIIVPFSNGEMHYLDSLGDYVFATKTFNYDGAIEANMMFDTLGMPAVQGRKIVVAGGGNSLKVIDSATANVSWERVIKTNSSPLLVGKNIFIQDAYGNVFAMNLDNSKIQWRVQLPKTNGLQEVGDVRWFGPVFASGKLVFSGSNGNILVLNASTGAVELNKNISWGHFVMKPIISNGKILLTTEKGHVYIVE